ncbi:uncharacterized protein F5891DRAFT_1184420 [Suillus fuscotomentosus]|uniref:Uncharacterized protein n=1 Tax=Suillus fuscotomentosus TaxID=1912939 RepID=A0AAD4HPW8_9AGAM|nr:uncharacterized protein F5891DRAFT_1184420 [Suillus fuscotomentosus]KAG1904226.1 hypothetical protein F5891DRAFT_1184420 [Suillus fuscotomentosus]
MFEDDLDIDQEFETSQPAAKYDCPPSQASPTLGDNEYFDREADADIIMGMDEDPVDRDSLWDDSPTVRRDLFVSVSILNTHADQVVAHSSQRRVSVSVLQARTMLSQVIAHRSQEVSVSTLIRATAMLTLQVVALCSQDDEVSVSTLIRATAMLTLQVVAHHSQEAHMGVGKGAGASEVSDTLGFTCIDP